MDPETEEEAQAFKDYADDFLNCVHSRYGYLVHYPLAGGYYDQPFRTMQIFSYMRIEYMKVISKKTSR